MSGERRLDLSLLTRALARLEEGLADLPRHPGVDAYRDSVVIRFVYTYETAYQVLRRYVQLEHGKPLAASEATVSRLVRRANALGIDIPEWEEFSELVEVRNGVAHTYDGARAERLIQLAPRLVEAARRLLREVEMRLNEL